MEVGWGLYGVGLCWGGVRVEGVVDIEGEVNKKCFGVEVVG